MNARLLPPTPATRRAFVASSTIVALTAAFLTSRYADLPDILPVHFTRYGFPDGWQFRTYARVMVPVFVQLALALTLLPVGALLLSRPHGDRDRDLPDVQAATTAAEAIALIALIWIAFQGYAAVALAAMWQRQRSGLGLAYTVLEVSGIVLTVVICARANGRLGRPAPRPFVESHWRLGQLYNNPADPALFVPTRDGSRWTLNFGRPVAAALVGLILLVGIVGPAAILRLMLR
ncbi:MAG TPA: DUF5808 domain-containing protein [Vicinamibacterales bacterium]|jgi:uncharacterized membrane protein